MDTEDRLKRLEELVSPEDQEGDITDAVMNLYGNFVHSLIWTGDFLFDLILRLVPDEESTEGLTPSP
jgi:hypothetical protein